jgi:hypothetical protein
MKLTPISLTFALFLSLTSVPSLQAKITPVKVAVPTNTSAIEGDLAEWELLKAYLSEVEKRSDLEIQMAYSDYKLNRLIFKESNRRWWETYKEDQRKEKINEYWQRFREGEKYARSVVEANVGNYCNLLSKVDLSVMSSPVEDANVVSAFARGFKGAYPECSISNLDQFLRDTDKRVSVVEKKIIDMRVNLLVSKPNEKDVEAIYNELKKKYVEATKTFLTSSKEKLESSFALPNEEVGRITESANLLAQAIGCPTLKSRAGEKFICTVQTLEAPVKLGLASTYRVLKNEQETGVFQPRLYLGQLMLASAVYLKEVNPNNQTVRYLADDISHSVEKLQADTDRKIQDARTVIAQDFFDQMRVLKFDTIDLNRGVFSKDAMMAIVHELLDIKPSIESYVRFDLSTQYESSILDKVLDHYRNTLQKASELKAEVQLPKRDVVVTLADEGTSDVVTLDSMPFPPKAYLLGLSQEEVQEWMDILAL